MKATIAGVADAEYYEKDIAADRHDYYAGYGEAPGRWDGTLAERLQLAGQVDPDAFRQLLDGVDPATGERLKPRPNMVLAHDVTFSPVKTVSVLWANADADLRERIVAALEGGHRHALAHLESTACVARLGAQGRDATVGRGFAGAVFRHRFSREGDPQLHWHTVLANVTETADGRRAALDGRLLYAEAPVAAARMEVYARAELTRDGIGWTQRNGYWEVAAVPPKLARLMSKRRVALEQHVEEVGGDVRDPRQTQGAALATRPAKQAAAGDVHDRWRAETLDAGYDPAELVAAAASTARSAGRAAAHAPAHRPLPARAPRGLRGRWRRSEGWAGNDSGADERAEASGRGGTSGPPLPGSGTARVGRHPALPADTGPGGDRHLGGGDGSGSAGLTDEQVVDLLLGSRGLTERASSFSRRDVVVAINKAVAVLGEDGDAALARLDALADRVLADPRVVALQEPVDVSGEVIRPRDQDSRVTGVVKIRDAERWTTAELLLAEHELLTRARARSDARAPVASAELVDEILADSGLDPDQEAMVRKVTTCGAGVQVTVGKAGTGKTTALRRAVNVWDRINRPVVGVAPSAAAALQLGAATGIDASTLDRLLVRLDAGAATLPTGVVVILDEAAMCSTRRRLELQRAVDAVGGTVLDVGDDAQIPSVDVGGCFSLLASELGASTLGINHRFRKPEFAEAAQLLSEGKPEQAIAILEAEGAVYEHPHREVVHRRMVADWRRLHEAGDHASMYATTHKDVEALNSLARAQLQTAGQLPRRGGRTYESPDGARSVNLVPGDRVRTGRNESVAQPDGTRAQVANGRLGTVTAVDRDRVTVDLDPLGDHPAATVTLPAAYAGDALGYGYAITADSAQGSTVGHGLFAPSGFGSLERGYVALSRGTWTNHIYATPNSGWRDRLTDRALHRPALTQHPDPDHPLLSSLRDHLERAVQHHRVSDAGDDRELIGGLPVPAPSPSVEKPEAGNRDRSLQPEGQRRVDRALERDPSDDSGTQRSGTSGPQQVPRSNGRGRAADRDLAGGASPTQGRGGVTM